jgi:hypothetical protein
VVLENGLRVSAKLASQRSASMRAYRVLVPMAALLLSSCASVGIVVIDLGVDAEISGVSPSGARWQSSAANFAREPVVPKASSTFPATVYNGPIFAWRFYAAPDSIGTDIRSNIPTPVCFRFDEARISSNNRPQPIPLTVNWVTIDGRPSWDEASTDATKRKMTKQCFSGTFTRFSFGPDASALFANGTLFDAALDKNRERMGTSGKGNSITIYVPIEYSGVREDVEIKLTVTDSATRISNFLR